MAPFAGFNMPIEFTGINAEHLWVREAVGVFDVSHMGELWVKGPKATALLQRITTNNVAALTDGKVQYTCFPNGKGGIVRGVEKLLASLHTESLALLTHKSPIFVDIGRIDGEQVALLIEAIEKEVIHNTTLTVGEAGVLHLTIGEGCYVVGSDALEERGGLGALNPQLTHMAHVEDAHSLPHPEVLGIDTRKLDGHIEACKGSHLGTSGNVILGKWSNFEVFHCVNSFSVIGFYLLKVLGPAPLEGAFVTSKIIICEKITTIFLGKITF
jgi:hypothetical protein